MAEQQFISCSPRWAFILTMKTQREEPSQEMPLTFLLPEILSEPYFFLRKKGSNFMKNAAFNWKKEKRGKQISVPVLSFTCFSKFPTRMIGKLNSI